MKRAGIIALSVVVLAVGAFAGYGWLTRRGEPSFSKGGAFGVPSASASASAKAERAQRRTTRRAEAKREPSSKTAGTSGGSVAAAAATVRVREPAEGRYTYDGSGHERVRFGAASPCSWDINTVSVDVRRDGDDHVFDTTFSENRQQRLIKRYTEGGIKISYLGAAVTCLGIRETTEDSYSPDPMSLEFPLEVGERWHSETETENRREDVDGKIVARERITVPAGTFLTYKVQTTVVLSGGQSGEAEMTYWFSPALGIDVKEIARTEAKSGDATFTSDYTIELARIP